jgi:hypothetical protein
MVALLSIRLVGNLIPVFSDCFSLRVFRLLAVQKKLEYNLSDPKISFILLCKNDFQIYMTWTRYKLGPELNIYNTCMMYF